MKYKITAIYLLGSILISLLPNYWWYYNIGDLIRIYDSPYNVHVYYFGSYLLLFKIINLILLGYRFYVVILYSGYLFYLLRGRFMVSSLFFWQTIVYVLWPIVAYLIANYLLYDVFRYNIYFPLFIFGNEVIKGNMSDSIGFSVLFEAYPEPVYWLALTISILYPFTYIEKRKR